MAHSKAVPAIDPDSHSAKMLTCLKEMLQARRLRYADVAAMMNVSEKSIKRYMTGKGVTLTIFEKLCAVAGMSLAELSELAGISEGTERPWTTDDQEAVLANEPKLTIVIALLSSGWTAARIVREGLSSQSELNSILLRLDRLGVITLHPNNRTTLKARLRPISTASEPLRRVRLESGHRVIKNLDLEGPGAQWRLGYARLGPASVERVVQRLDAFLADVSALSRQDMDLHGDQVKWHAVCGLISESEMAGFKHLREAAPTDT